MGLPTVSLPDNIVILGSSRSAHELFWLLHEVHPGTRVVFADDLSGETETEVDGIRVPVVGNWDFSAVDCFDGAGPRAFRHFLTGLHVPADKRVMVGKALAHGLEPAPSFVHPRAWVQGHYSATMGRGGVFMPGCMVSTNVHFGDYVYALVNTAVGHDAVIGDYCSLLVGSAVSGRSTLGEAVVVGTNAVVKQGLNIADGVVIGASACVVKNVDEPGVSVAGVPANPIGPASRL